MNRFTIHLLSLLLWVTGLLVGCNSRQQSTDKPVVGFVEAFEDATIARAREGFVEALADSGYKEEDGSVKIIYRNAQGDIAALNQIVNYFAREKVALIGTSTTLATLAAVQRGNNTPVFMTVTAMPHILGLNDKTGNPPTNLYGTGEELNYIDTSFAIIPSMIKPAAGKKVRVGMIYNQSEPQSVDAYNRINTIAGKMGISLVAMPLNTSADAQLVTRALLNEGVDAFFANPDNTVFAAFETILKNCNEKNVPVFTSESGLVERGAVAAFGADIYQWGYQAGAQAGSFLKHQSTKGLHVELLKVRKRVYNPEAASRFKFVFPPNFEKISGLVAGKQ